MDKRIVMVSGHEIIQLTDTEYEAENPAQNLDFYFDVQPEVVEVFVFDSLVETSGDEDPCIATLYAENLEGAVVWAMSLEKFKRQSRQYNIFERLREISARLDREPGKLVLFPGWHQEEEGLQEELIKIAAQGILAQNKLPDDGTYVSYKSIAALLHYIADMME